MQTLLTSSIQQTTVVHVGGHKTLPAEKIVNFEADGNYTIVNLVDGSRFVVATTLKLIENRLTDFSHFLRVNNSMILNLNHVSQRENVFILPNRKIITFSRRKWRTYKNSMV
jgi:DNA-binding LytR/AlgR family response regulator